MNLDRFSDRAQAAVTAAEAYAADLKHDAVLPAHLLVALLADRDGAVRALLTGLGADPGRLEKKAHAELARTAGSQRAPSLDPTTETVLSDADRQSRREGDKLVRTRHLLVAVADGSPGIARTVLEETGVTRTALKFALKDFADGSGEKKGKRGLRPTASRADRRPASNDRKSRRAVAAQPAADGESMLEQFGRDLTALARTRELDPIVGRDAEIRRLMQVLGRRTKNNPILIGEAGVGKTAIVEGFAYRLVSEDIPFNLKDKRLYELDLGALVAGTTLRGQFEERVKTLVSEVAESNGHVILYIDEIHTLVGAGGKGDSGGAANMLKPALARGEVTLIGTTTPAEYRKHIESDKALERRFQEIHVDEPDFDATVAIMRGIKERYEIHHRVRILDSAIQAAVRLSERYVSDRKLPDKAVDLVDEAASRLRMQIDSQPTAVYELKRGLLNCEMQREVLKSETDADSLRELAELEQEIETRRAELDAVESRLGREKELLDRITELKAELEATRKLAEKAQEEGDLGRAAELKYAVIKRLEDDLESETAALDKLHESGRMIREEVTEEDIALVVADWTGVPTTKMLEGERKKLLAVAERLEQRVVGQTPAVEAIAAAVRRSRAGLQERNRPIGNFFFVGPTGVGKTELAKALAEFLFDSEEALIRIDMSEYMEQSKVNTLIGAAYGYVDSDKGGILTEAVRRRPYSVVLFDEAEKAHPDVFNILLQVLDEGRLSDSQGRVIDFTNTIIIMTSNVGAREILDLTGRVSYEELDEKVHMILRDHFKPEFLNRLDDTIVFAALDRDSMEKIADILFAKFRKLLAEQDLAIEFTAEAREHIIEVGFQPEYGARPLKRALLTEVQDPLATYILDGTFVGGDTIMADLHADGDRLTFAKRD